MKRTHLQDIKLFAKINGRDVLPDVKMYVVRNKRAIETKPRENQETLFRIELLKVLRKLKYGGQVKFWRIENSLPGYKGIPDFYIMSKRTGWSGWVELKIVGGAIQKEQKEFAEFCHATGINHIFAYNIKQVMELI